MAEKRRRGQNFSIEDKDKLIKLLLLHKDTILNKKTDGTTNDAKNNSWIAITNSFNSSSNTHRSKESLMKAWENLKRDSKVYHVKMRRSMTQTGGGPSIIKLDPVLEQVCSILGRSCTGILGVLDCDSETGPENEMSLPKVIALSDDACHPSEQEKIITVSIEEGEEPEIFQEKECDAVVTLVNEAQVNNILDKSQTPLWSRRLPHISKFNERSEASTLVSSSIQNVYQKKGTVEDLREQLIREELEFKRKLYELQLQAAVKEVEIKTAILEQIKGGGFSFSNLLGTQPKKD